MSEASSSRNLEFFQHMLSIGMIDEDQYQTICRKCQAGEENKMLFQVSNYFSDFTASDWFDLSCRMYSSWQKPLQTEQRLSSPRPNQHKNKFPQTLPTKNSIENLGTVKAQNQKQDVLGAFKIGEKRAFTENSEKHDFKDWQSSQKLQKLKNEDFRKRTSNKPF